MSWIVHPADLAAEDAEPRTILREPVHPRRNVERFPAVLARHIRFVVEDTNRGEPCLDELEVYGPARPGVNLALGSGGAQASASGSYAGYGIHTLEGVNDGRYGNGRSWIADRVAGAWVRIDFGSMVEVDQVVWGRDREGHFIDRLATAYRIEVSEDGREWRPVASGADRQPLTGRAARYTGMSITSPLANRFAPAGTTLSVESGRRVGEYGIDVWQTSDGLPGNTVTAICQTVDGYLWIGTLNGLVRFDGVRFVVFGEGSELPNTRVLSLLGARDGSLWIGTDGGGMVRYDGEKFRTWTELDGLEGNTVMCLAEGLDGTIHAGGPRGLSQWRDGVLKGVHLGELVEGMATGQEGDLWVVIRGMHVLDGARLPMRRPTGPDPSAFTGVLAVTVGGSGRVWYGGVNGYVGCQVAGRTEVYREQPGQLLDAAWALCETRDGNLWVGTASGGLRRLKDGNFTSITTEDGLSDNSVRSLYEDREGNLWVGTVGGGLNRIRPRRLTTLTTRDGLSHNVVMSLAEDVEGRVWVGSNCGGLSVGRDGRFEAYYANYLLDNQCIWSLLPAPDGSLWVGTWDGGLFRIRDREVENHPVRSAENDDAVTALCEDGVGGVWVGTMQGGLKRFVGVGWEEDARTAAVTGVGVTALVREPDGGLWVGTLESGLWRVPADGEGIQVWNRATGLPSNRIRTVHRDPDGVLWVGTGNGLVRWAGGRLRVFGMKEGLPDGVISQIVDDGLGYLWFGCNRGVFRVDRRDFDAVIDGDAARVNAILYGLADGLESLECTGGFHPAGLRTGDGRLWFSTVKGVVRVDPAQITTRETPPPVRVEEVWADGVAVREGMELGPGLERIEFRFTALGLDAAERNRFRHRLEGLETDWTAAGIQRVAVYTRLPPGAYVFRVMACNRDGIWNEEGASLRFTVLPHAWQTMWFRGLVVTVVIGGSSWVVRFAAVRRLRRRLRQLEERHTVEQERIRIARDIHDELGANLTRITLLTELGRNHWNQPEVLQTDLRRISATAREAVRSMDSIVWAINPQNDTLDHFINYLAQFAGEFLREAGLRCRLDLPTTVAERELSAEVRHHLLLVVKEALNNVVRHARATEVRLGLVVAGDELSLMVSDDGCGLPVRKDGEGRHDGLGNMRRRMEDLGGTCALESVPGSGTTLRFQLRLPRTSHRAS